MLSDLAVVDGERAAALASAGAFLASRGWLPATGGNLSARLDASHALVTRSGVDKASLRPDDFLRARLDELTLPGGSAETPLHLSRYAADAKVGCVLHVHTVASTVLSRLAERDGEIRIQGYEMQKALGAIDTHEGTLVIPVIPNAQETIALAGLVEARLATLVDPAPGYLLAGHGLYAWGRDVAEARRHVEAFEFLLQCTLEERRLTQ